jgi:hypothetical protein
MRATQEFITMSDGSMNQSEHAMSQKSFRRALRDEETNAKLKQIEEVSENDSDYGEDRYALPGRNRKRRGIASAGNDKSGGGNDIYSPNTTKNSAWNGDLPRGDSQQLDLLGDDANQIETRNVSPRQRKFRIGAINNDDSVDLRPVQIDDDNQDNPAFNYGQDDQKSAQKSQGGDDFFLPDDEDDAAPAAEAEGGLTNRGKNVTDEDKADDDDEQEAGFFF